MLRGIYLTKVLHADLKVPTVREEITKFSVKYRDKITTYPKPTCIHTTGRRRRRAQKIEKIQTNTFNN